MLPRYRSGACIRRGRRRVLGKADPELARSLTGRAGVVRRAVGQGHDVEVMDDQGRFGGKVGALQLWLSPYIVTGSVAKQQISLLG